MKTFVDYLRELLIIIAFGAALAWLVSCSNRKQHIIDLIHAYNDSIGLNKTRIAVLRFPIDSMRDEYEKDFPPQRYFPGQEAARARYADREHVAYKKLLKDIEKYELYVMLKRLSLEYKNARYKEMIDSLKVELYR